MTLEPDVVARRLARLAAIYVPETIAEGRARMRADCMAPDSIVTTVARRLEELRALDELARYLAKRK